MQNTHIPSDELVRYLLSALKNMQRLGKIPAQFNIESTSVAKNLRRHLINTIIKSLESLKEAIVEYNSFSDGEITCLQLTQEGKFYHATGELILSRLLVPREEREKFLSSLYLYLTQNSEYHINGNIMVKQKELFLKIK